MVRKKRPSASRRIVRPKQQTTTTTPDAGQPTHDVIRRGGKASLIDAYRHLVGHRPDAEIAAMAKVSPKAVNKYRRRHGLPHTGSPSPAAAPTAPRARAAESAVESETPLRRGGKSSPLDPYVHLLGTMTDGDLADRAGMSREAVYQYRRRRRIPAFKPKGVPTDQSARPQTTPPPSAEPTEEISLQPAPTAGSGGSANDRAVEREPELPTAGPTQVAAAPPPVTLAAGSAAFVVAARPADGEERRFYVVGGSIAEAAGRTLSSLGMRAGGPWEVLRIERVGEALSA